MGTSDSITLEHMTGVKTCTQHWPLVIGFFRAHFNTSSEWDICFIKESYTCAWHHKSNEISVYSHF